MINIYNGKSRNSRRFRKSLDIAGDFDHITGLRADIACERYSAMLKSDGTVICKDQYSNRCFRLLLFDDHAAVIAFTNAGKVSIPKYCRYRNRQGNEVQTLENGAAKKFDTEQAGHCCLCAIATKIKMVGSKLFPGSCNCQKL